MNQPDVGYVSSLYGGFWNFDTKDFCYMTNPYFPPQEFIDSLGSRLRQLVKSYPSTNWYISSLAAKPLGLTHEELVVANGASELISALTDQFVEHLSVPVPTFDEFVNRAASQGKRVSPYQLTGDFELDAEDFVRHTLSVRANAALLINPNNPTGTLLTHDTLWYLLESLRGLDLVLVDESFIEFSSRLPTPSVMGRLSDFPNVVVLKSLSKNYGVPGLRLGYAASANKEMVATLRRSIPIWSINSLAQYFLEEVDNYQDEYVESCANVREAAHILYSGLEALHYLRPYPSQGNFVLCKLEDGLTGSELTERLFKECNILINDCSRKKGLGNEFVRFASRTVEENAQLIQTMQELGSTIPVGERAHT